MGPETATPPNCTENLRVQEEQNRKGKRRSARQLQTLQRQALQNNSCHMLRENGGSGIPFKSDKEMAERRDKRQSQVNKRKATASLARKSCRSQSRSAAAAAAPPSPAPAPATGAGFVAGGARDTETTVVPPGTAHTEPADSLIATLFGGGEQSLSLVDSGGSALWVSNSLAPGLEELTTAAPHAPGEPMRGSLGRGGGAVMKGILKTSTTPSCSHLSFPGPSSSLHLAPGAPRERIVHSSMPLYVDNSSGNGG